MVLSVLLGDQRSHTACEPADIMADPTTRVWRTTCTAHLDIYTAPPSGTGMVLVDATTLGLLVQMGFQPDPRLDLSTEPSADGSGPGIAATDTRVATWLGGLVEAAQAQVNAAEASLTAAKAAVAAGQEAAQASASPPATTTGAA